jgi:hypothetical protein
MENCLLPAELYKIRLILQEKAFSTLWSLKMEISNVGSSQWTEEVTIFGFFFFFLLGIAISRTVMPQENRIGFP